MFICDEKKNLSVSNTKYINLAFKETEFVADNDYMKNQAELLASRFTDETSRTDIIMYVIDVIECAEKNNFDVTDMLRVFHFLADRFGFGYQVNTFGTEQQVTAYKYASSCYNEIFVVPISRIKYVKQHDRVIKKNGLSLCRVSIVTTDNEEFKLHIDDQIISSLKCDVILKCAVKFIDQAL